MEKNITIYDFAITHPASINNNIFIKDVSCIHPASINSCYYNKYKKYKKKYIIIKKLKTI